MSLDACIPGLVASGQLTPERGKRVLSKFEELKRFYRGSMGDAAASAEATARTIEQLHGEALLKKRQEALQIAAQKAALDNMASFTGGSRSSAALALFDHDWKGRAPYSNVEARRKLITGQAHGMLTDVLARYRRKVTGVLRNKAEMDDFVRATFGEGTKNINVRELADAWGQASEYLRQRFNAAGGDIGKLEKWGLPQHHDSAAVRAVSYAEWGDFIKPLLDRSRMIDRETGLPFTDAALDAALQDVYRNIRSNGWASRNAGGGGGGRKLANQRAESRFLIFDGANNWLAYHDRFGSGTPFDLMTGHVEGMSRDIAHMEILGPNPAATVKWLQDTVQKEANEGLSAGTGEINTARGGVWRIGKMYEATSGALSTPVNEGVARTFGSVRSYLVAAQLGSAFLSGLTDVGWQAVTRAFNGMPIRGALTGYLKLFRPSFNGDQKLAVRMGLIAEEAARSMSAQSRYMNDVISGEMARRWADGVLRISGLSPWTQAGRWAFGMEFMGHLADLAGKGFDDLGATGTAMRRYGFTAADWDKIRATVPYEHKGARFLRPDEVEGSALGERLMEMILTETDAAVPAVTPRARSWMSAAPPGTLLGEASRNVGLFKSFGVTMLLTHGARAMAGTPYQRVLYAGGAAITTTMLGAMVMGLRDVIKGQDPGSMQTPEFWTRAALQGGGFGVFGDFVGSAVLEQRANSLASALAGPVEGVAEDAISFTAGNAWQAADWAWRGGRKKNGDTETLLEKTDIGREATRLVKRYTPGGSLWYARLGYERIFVDQAQSWADPDYQRSWRTLEAKRSYWWPHGSVAPERAPDLSTATQPEGGNQP